MLERILGNEQLKQDLSAALAHDRMTHSILLVGETGAGAGFAARCLAADFLFPQGGPHAEAVLRSESSECTEIRGEGVSGDIPVARVRDMRLDVFGTSLSSAGRCVIIYGAQHFNGSSANALLKVLEEPPANVLFILTANSLAGLLPTIRSRCASYVLSPVPQALCVSRLCQSAGCEPPQAEFLAQVYDGRLGQCLAAAQQPERAASLQNAQKFCRLVAQKNEYAALALLTAYEGGERAAALQFLDDCVALCAATLRRPGLTELSAPAAAETLREVRRAIERVQANANRKLALTLLGAHLCAR